MKFNVPRGPSKVEEEEIGSNWGSDDGEQDDDRGGAKEGEGEGQEGQEEKPARLVDAGVERRANTSSSANIYNTQGMDSKRGKKTIISPIKARRSPKKLSFRKDNGREGKLLVLRPIGRHYY